MSREIAELSGQVARATRADRQEPGFGDLSLQFDAKVAEAPETALLPGEENLLREAIRSLQAIRYGSVVLVKHDGRLVEVNTTVRIRGGRTITENDKSKR